VFCGEFDLINFMVTCKCGHSMYYGSYAEGHTVRKIKTVSEKQKVDNSK